MIPKLMGKKASCSFIITELRSKIYFSTPVVVVIPKLMGKKASCSFIIIELRRKIYFSTLVVVVMTVWDQKMLLRK